MRSVTHHQEIVVKFNTSCTELHRTHAKRQDVLTLSRPSGKLCDVTVNFFFLKYFIVPRGKFGWPCWVRLRQRQDQRYLYPLVCAVFSCVQIMVWLKLQALVYDILPSTTAVFSYAIGSRKLSANEQFLVGAQTVVGLLQTTQIK